ncbi:MAB_1171c family putative transporter [Streptomyces abikoensis]|uniref:MAB_1171c family putative transporter n=1 Tax=Streptomyces abikoensis TaxID=97398 RepID=A0ABW7TA44_9ACTN
MSDEGYWIPALAIWVALAGRLPALMRNRHDPLLRAVCTVLLLNGSAFFCANPWVVGLVNRATGIPNFAAPLVYGLICALSAACIVLIIYWRDGNSQAARKTAHRWILTYSIGIALIIAAFTVGDAPVERRVDLDTYYATAPGMREMIVLYLLAVVVGSVAMTAMCWRWAPQVRHRAWLRRGLHTIALGYIISLGFAVLKGAAVAARWTGNDWDELSTLAAPPVATIGTLTAAAGFLMPLLGERLTALRSTLDDWLTYRALRPLWDALRAATPSVVAPMAMPWWDIDLRLTRRIAEIHDGRLALRPYCDTSVADAARSRAESEGLSNQDADAVAEAATLIAAVTAKAQGVEPAPAASDPFDEPPHRCATLVQISRALSSPTVAAFSRPAHQQETRP